MIVENIENLDNRSGKDYRSCHTPDLSKGKSFGDLVHSLKKRLIKDSNYFVILNVSETSYLVVVPPTS